VRCGAGPVARNENDARVRAIAEAKDITSIGAGPTGLFAAFLRACAAHRSRLIDTSIRWRPADRLYPKIHLRRRGIPKILAKDFVKGLAEQGLQ